MFDKKFKIVLFLFILIIVLVMYGKDIFSSFSSVSKITALTEPKSLDYYKKSCEYEDSEMCNTIGDMYHYGKDMVSVDYEEAFKYYKKSCELENGKGCNNLGFLFNQERGVKRNNWTAIRLYQKACDYGEMEACYNVGAMYYNGEGTKRNYYKAVYYFQKSCNNDIGAGCNNLGYMYENGKYVKGDIRQAISHYADACDMKNASGCKNLAHIKEKKGNLAAAKQLYKRACLLGDKHSCNRLENVLGNRIVRITNPVELSESIKACNDSTKGGTMCYKVGLYYEQEEDSEKAHEYFEKACNREQSQACKRLGDLFRK